MNIPSDHPAAAALGIDVIDMHHFAIAPEARERVLARARRWCALVDALEPSEDARTDAARAWATAEAAVKADRSRAAQPLFELEQSAPGVLEGRFRSDPFMSLIADDGQGVLALTLIGGVGR